MENPYLPPSDSTLHPVDANGSPSAFGVAIAAVLTAFAAYIPINGIRGACFCLFPGIALRSVPIGLIGALIGFFVDIAVSIVWMNVAGAWEPRWGGYNSILSQYLPPDIMVATHVGSPMPNSLKFGLGLMLWSATMHLTWLSLWKPRLEWDCRLTIVGIGSVIVCVGATILWMVAPLTGTLGVEYQPFGDLPLVPFLAVFVSTMPVCSLVVGLLIYWSSLVIPRAAEESEAA